MPAKAQNRYATCEKCGRYVSTQAAARAKHACERKQPEVEAKPVVRERQPRPLRVAPRPATFGTPHCAWCADPWRAVLLYALRQHVKAIAVADYYGLFRTTVVYLRVEATKRGCFDMLCRFCPAPVFGHNRICNDPRCKSANYVYMRRLQRRKWALGGRGHVKMIPPGTVMLPLPENPRLRKPTQARPVLILGEVVGRPPPAPVARRKETARPVTPPPVRRTYDPLRRFALGSVWLGRAA